VYSYRKNETESENDTESGTATTPKALPKPQSERQISLSPRIRIQKPRGASVLKPTATESENDTESGTETASENVEVLYNTLKVLRQRGKVTAAAAALGVSRTTVNNQLRALYKIDPAAVEEAVPDWVERNIGIVAQ